jgi:hypothetical protein
LELCAKIGDVEGEGNAHQVAARIDWWAFDVGSARRHLRIATSIFERIGKPQSRASVAINAGALENHVGLLDAAERYYAEALTYADQLQSPTLRILCHGNFAYAALLREDGTRALAEARQALALARDANDSRLIAINLGHVASASRLLDRDVTEILAGFDEALELCASYGFADERLELIAQMLPTLVSPGKLEQALTFAAEIQRAISADAGAVVMPADALAKAADAFAAAGDEAAASAVRNRASALLRERLEKLPDPETRAAYEALPFHRALLDAAPANSRSLERQR